MFLSEMVLIEIVDASLERLMGVFNIQSAGWSLDDSVLVDKKTLCFISFSISKYEITVRFGLNRLRTDFK